MRAMMRAHWLTGRGRTRVRSALFGAAATLLISATTAMAQAPKIWDVAFGTPVAALPLDQFVDAACGTNGGPPARVLKSFAEFAQCARERTTGYALSRGGLQGEPQPVIVYVSAHSHSSVDKAALLAGFGRENVHVVPHDADYAMRPDALGEAIAADRRRGAKPCAVVATVGTTTSTALDPIEAIAGVTQPHGLWIHVDAAMAGSAMILPECREMWRGIERVDSLVVNAHKWLGSVFDCSLYYVRDAEHLVRVMSTNPSYLQSSADGRVKNFRDWGLPLGRRFRALKLWFLIREQGVSGLQARLRRDIANAQWLTDQVRAAAGWRVLAPVPLQTLCVRHEPAGLEGDALDRHTLAWVDRVNRSGAAYLTPALLDGRWMARVSIGVEPTERAHVEALWTTMRAEAER